MSGAAWTLEFYEEGGREPVLEFLRGLDELKGARVGRCAAQRSRL